MSRKTLLSRFREIHWRGNVFFRDERTFPTINSFNRIEQIAHQSSTSLFQNEILSTNITKQSHTQRHFTNSIICSLPNEYSTDFSVSHRNVERFPSCWLNDWATFRSAEWFVHQMRDRREICLFHRSTRRTRLRQIFPLGRKNRRRTTLLIFFFSFETISTDEIGSFFRCQFRLLIVQHRLKMKEYSIN